MRNPVGFGYIVFWGCGEAAGVFVVKLYLPKLYLQLMPVM